MKKPRLLSGGGWGGWVSPGRALDAPSWTLFPNTSKALSLRVRVRGSESLSLSGFLVFGGFAFLPVSLGPAGDCPCKD